MNYKAFEYKGFQRRFCNLGNTGYAAGGPVAWLAAANQILKKEILLGLKNFSIA
jgi:hypothetical protein